MEVLVLIRSISFILIVLTSFVLVTGQAPHAPKTDTDKVAKPSTAAGTKKLRDVPFPAGVDLKFIIIELARELDLNVLFDPDSFRSPRKTDIELKNVTAAAALDYVLLQEKLFFEEVGPRTILVATQVRQPGSIPQIGVGVTLLFGQLPQYYRVDSGLLINSVRDNSPASLAELKVGDVIAEIDGVPVRGGINFIRAINDKEDGNITLTVVHDHKRRTISLTAQKGVGSIL